MQKFQNDWATLELVKQTLTNRRKDLRKKGKIGGAQAQSNEGEDDSEDIERGGSDSNGESDEGGEGGQEGASDDE